MHRDTRFYCVQPARVTTYNCYCFLFCSIVSALIDNDDDEHRTVCLRLLHITITLWLHWKVVRATRCRSACLRTMQYIHTNQVGIGTNSEIARLCSWMGFVYCSTFPITKLQRVFLFLVKKTAMAFFIFLLFLLIMLRLLQRYVRRRYFFTTSTRWRCSSYKHWTNKHIESNRSRALIYI